MEKEKYKKVIPKLSEEIKMYSKTFKAEIIKGIVTELFHVEIPYNGFKIILSHPLIKKRNEKYYYKNSKYGWWTFCAKKSEMDSWDKKIASEKANHYGRYREDDHTFCNDNMEGGKYFYNLHPDEMVDDVKQQINIFLRDKEIEIARSKMTKEDHERIELRAKIFLESVVKENSECVQKIEFGKDKKIDLIFRALERGTMRVYGGWLVKGRINNYFVDTTGKAYYYNPSGEVHLSPICVVPKWDNKYIHLYDHIASRILALMNDDKTKKYIHTLKI